MGFTGIGPMLGCALVWALIPVKPKALPYTKYTASSFFF